MKKYLVFLLATSLFADHTEVLDAQEVNTSSKVSPLIAVASIAGVAGIGAAVGYYIYKYRYKKRGGTNSIKPPVLEIHSSEKSHE